MDIKSPAWQRQLRDLRNLAGKDYDRQRAETVLKASYQFDDKPGPPDKAIDFLHNHPDPYVKRQFKDKYGVEPKVFLGPPAPAQ